MAYEKSLARRLRKTPTEAERRLWAMLRGRRFNGYTFRRQYPVGQFVADFACVEGKLIVEADGGQHADQATDAKRTDYLEKQKWRVLRFWNHDILINTESVMETILAVLEGRHDEG